MKFNVTLPLKRIRRPLSIVVLAVLSSCHPSSQLPIGNWHSDSRRTDISIHQKTDGTCFAIVYHRIHGGGICPVEYPIVCTAFGTYIQAEGRILISYDADKDTNVMYLSPGGTYHRIHNTFHVEFAIQQKFQTEH